MTRDDLLNSICPMSRVYDCCIADGDYDCDNCKRLIKEWFDEYDKQIRTDAIEEFVKAIEKHQTRQDSYLDPPYVEMGLDMTDVLEVAEKLKEQNK